MSVVTKAVSFLSPKTSGRKIGPIAIDFGLESIHLVQLAIFAGRAPVVRARAALPFGGARREVLVNPR
jgi:hypothetical protein